MSDNSDLDYTIKVGFDADPLKKTFAETEKNIGDSSKKIGDKFEKTLSDSSQATSKTLKGVLQETNKTMQTLNDNLQKHSETFNKKLDENTNKVKKNIQSTSVGLKSLVTDSWGALSGIAGAFGVGMGLSGLFNSIQQNAQLSYRSTGLNTTPHDMSAFQQGARQSGIDGGVADSLFNTVATMQTKQFSSKADEAAGARQYLTRINTLLDVNDKDEKGAEKSSDEYLLSIIKSKKLRQLSPMAQRAMLQDALGVDVATAGELLDPKLIANIDKAKQSTAITNKEAEEAKKDDQSIETAKNSLWKGVAKTVQGIDWVSTKAANLYSYFEGAFKKDPVGAILGHTNAYDNTLSKVASNKLFGTDEKTGQYSDKESTKIQQMIDDKNPKTDTTGIINDKGLKKWQSAYESNRTSFWSGNPSAFDYAEGDQGKSFGAYQIQVGAANDPEMQKQTHRTYTKQDLYNHSTNEMLRDLYMKIGIDYAKSQAKKMGRVLTPDEERIAGLAHHNGGNGGVDYYLKYGRTKNNYAETIMEKAQPEINITQNINVTGATPENATKIAKTITDHAKTELKKLPAYNLAQGALKA